MFNSYSKTMKWSLTCIYFYLYFTVQGFKIINGETAPENSMQYMVSVQNIYGKHICGGFLISEDFVMTAAHCND